MSIDIECKNISISGEMGGGGGSYCLPNSTNLGNRKRFILVFPEPLTGSEMNQNKTAVFIKNALKTSKM